jgi:hypothetical protein
MEGQNCFSSTFAEETPSTKEEFAELQRARRKTQIKSHAQPTIFLDLQHRQVFLSI